MSSCKDFIHVALTNFLCLYAGKVFVNISTMWFSNSIFIISICLLSIMSWENVKICGLMYLVMSALMNPNCNCLTHDALSSYLTVDLFFAGILHYFMIISSIVQSHTTLRTASWNANNSTWFVEVDVTIVSHIFKIWVLRLGWGYIPFEIFLQFHQSWIPNVHDMSFSCFWPLCNAILDPRYHVSTALNA